MAIGLVLQFDGAGVDEYLAVMRELGLALDDDSGA